MAATCTGLDEIAAEAERRGVLDSQDLDSGEPAIMSHHALWRIFADETGGDGWWAVRVDLFLRDFPETRRLIGPSTMSADHLIQRMLYGRARRPDPFDEHPGFDVAHPWVTTPSSAWYARCPVAADRAGGTPVGCGFTGAVTATAFAVTTDGTVDLNSRILVDCPICGRRFDGRLQAVPAMYSRTCPRCASHIPAPWEAAHLRCERCDYAFVSPDVRGAHLAGLTAALSRHGDDHSGHPRRGAWSAS